MTPTLTELRETAERLRRLVILDEVGSDNPLGRDAADQIDALLAALEEAEKALEPFAHARENSGSALKLADFDHAIAARNRIRNLSKIRGAAE
jgi:hypothetical protein